MLEISPATTQAAITEHGLQNVPFTIDPALCLNDPLHLKNSSTNHNPAAEDIELMELDDEDLARDRLISGHSDSPFLINFDLDATQFDSVEDSIMDTA